MPISLSETAAKEIKSIIKDQGLAESVALRVGVKGGGCSGLSYNIRFEDLVRECRSRPATTRRKRRTYPPSRRAT